MKNNISIKELKFRIGMLRQWLNEKPVDRLVTNEDLEYWLFDSELAINKIEESKK